MYMSFKCFWFFHIKYKYKFFIQQDVNVKLKIKTFYILLRKRGLICLVQERNKDILHFIEKTGSNLFSARTWQSPIGLGLSPVLGQNHFQNKCLFAIYSESFEGS